MARNNIDKACLILMVGGKLLSVEELLPQAHHIIGCMQKYALKHLHACNQADRKFASMSDSEKSQFFLENFEFFEEDVKEVYSGYYNVDHGRIWLNRNLDCQRYS